MAAEKRDDNETPEPGGVFGNLPPVRPGARSPRRSGEEPAEPAADLAEQAAARAEPKPPPEPEGDRPSTPPPPPPPPGAQGEEPVAAPGVESQPRSIEDLAWAGIAVAAQTATAGVRFASRALEAARKSIERS